MPRTPPLAPLVLAVLLAGAGTPAHAARAHGAPEAGRRPVRHEALVDLGPFADCLTWRYGVRDGDTLGAIAERELGGARRAAEIRALNPEVDPRRLHVGRALAMPPRSLACARGEARFVFYAWAADERGWSGPRRLADGREHRVGHGVRLFAVPLDHWAAVCEAAGEQPPCAALLERHPAVARSEPILLAASVPAGDPTARIVTRYAVRAVVGDRVELARTGEARFDAADRRLAGAARAPDGHPIGIRLLVLAAMLAALGWATWRGRGAARPAALLHASYEPSPAAPVQGGHHEPWSPPCEPPPPS